MRRHLMFLSHRPPWPPNKGEKIRAWHILEHLTRDFDVHLGCVADDPADLAHAQQLQEICADVAIFPVGRLARKLNVLTSARPGRAMMPDFYTSPGLRNWVGNTVAQHRMDAVLIYTAAMAPYALNLDIPTKLLDAVDIDSEKWAAYAVKATWPMRLFWAREARNLLRYERRAAASCHTTIFVSQAEADRFVALAPETAAVVDYMENGVELDRFSPTESYDSPFTTTGPALVFTGHMDYWPNADAVIWFAQHVMPGVRAAQPGTSFWVVGANPGVAVRRLADQPDIFVTGWVEDTRPYLAHAAICVCPLLMARGIQNKVLEAMAMARPVVASPAAFEGIRAQAGRDLLVAKDAAAFTSAIAALLSGSHPALGSCARRAMELGYAWPDVLTRLDTIITKLTGNAALQPDGSYQ